MSLVILTSRFEHGIFGRDLLILNPSRMMRATPELLPPSYHATRMVGRFAIDGGYNVHQTHIHDGLLTLETSGPKSEPNTRPPWPVLFVGSTTANAATEERKQHHVSGE
ncbi:hypothetical protein AVEN_182143-1 [Araneus ventricosus]|uniref:Uncharacterized protein n=1 Tax=Araneus ventricosus TaxID=182803 RepID=A0A4Y2GQL1_ARAVE|nr:hypothetical protein AVEN_182143-1 [Araneus ventricosus]